MTTTAFGTLDTARGLEAAGFGRRQAEVLARAVRNVAGGESRREHLATKAHVLPVVMTAALANAALIVALPSCSRSRARHDRRLYNPPRLDDSPAATVALPVGAVGRSSSVGRAMHS